jgi:hypothetical protein
LAEEIRKVDVDDNAGIAPRTIENAETSKKIRINTLSLIAKALGIDPKIIEYTDSPIELLYRRLVTLQHEPEFTDQIWPVIVHRPNRDRDLGTLPDHHNKRSCRLGSRIHIALELNLEGHLLLLDQGTSGTMYCLCPSQFAQNTRLSSGRINLPQIDSDHDTFFIAGHPGRERLLAIITDKPLNLDWIPSEPNTPARALYLDDIDTITSKLGSMHKDCWKALTTHFNLIE